MARSDRDDDTSAGLILLVGGILITLLVILPIGVWLFRTATADVRGEADVREQTRADGDFRIAAYERFYDLCASVQGKEATLASLREQLTAGPSPARAEQIQASIGAVQAQRAQSIATYNADARKAGTVADFRASDLPPSLDPSAEETSCTVA